MFNDQSFNDTLTNDTLTNDTVSFEQMGPERFMFKVYMKTKVLMSISMRHHMLTESL